MTEKSHVKMWQTALNATNIQILERCGKSRKCTSYHREQCDGEADSQGIWD